MSRSKLEITYSIKCRFCEIVKFYPADFVPNNYRRECESCHKLDFSPVWDKHFNWKQSPSKKKKPYKCKDCKTPVWCRDSRCRQCDNALRRVSAKPQNRVKKTPILCIDCQKECQGERCRECINIFKRQKMAEPTPLKHPKRIAGQPIVKTEQPIVKTETDTLKRLADYLLRADKIIGNRFLRLPIDTQKRAAIGIIRSMKAQKRNFKKSFENHFRLDIDPIREIIDDAKKGIFYFEEIEREKAEREHPPIRRYTKFY